MATIVVQVRYTCVRGRRFVGGLQSKKIRCEIDGWWTPQPQMLRCLLTSCPPFHRYQHMQIDNVVSGRHYYGDQVVVTCHHGYVLQPQLTEVTFTCGEDGIWSPNYHLSQPLQCYFDSCTPPPVQLTDGSRRDDVTRSFARGDYVIYKCPPGLYYNHTKLTVKSLKCGPSDTWQPVATDQLCVPLSCPRPRMLS